MRSLRLGYTTGACAAAAAKAAALALLSQGKVEEVEIVLPTGSKANFKIRSCSFGKSEAVCSVVKDAGDDPDVTDGAEICARVEWGDWTGVTIEGGEGVGRVTKPGLEVPVGEPAINPVPRRMIRKAIEEALGERLEGRGVKVTIFVPRGEELAKKTLNSRLGIIGGISILGTTGIVVPYSKEAYTACISLGLGVAKACGCPKAVLTTGRRSERFAQRVFELSEECFVQMGDYVGYAIEESVKKGFQEIVIWGMIGKIGKLASGVFYTHAHSSPVDIGFLSDVAESCGIERGKLLELRKAVGAHHFLRTLGEEERRKVCEKICLLAAERARERSGFALSVDVVISDFKGNILGRGRVG